MFKFVKFIFKWLLRLAILAVVLVVILLLTYNSILRLLMEHDIRKQTGMDAEIGRFHLSLFEPVIEIQNLKLYNPTNFAGTPFLNISEIHIEYDPDALRNRQIHIILVRFSLAELDIVKNQSGQFNILALGKKLPAKGANVSPAFNFGMQTDYSFTGIDTLNFSFGREKFIDLQDPSKDGEQTVGIQNCIVPHVKSANDLDGLILLVGLRSNGFVQQLPGMTSQTGNTDAVRDVLKIFGATF
ncbi:MAG TPA: AsmA family protein [Verrucomicrobiae bacterium]|nr:AsmA family protein [Verrucomicrobiae bacterium]